MRLVPFACLGLFLSIRTASGSEPIQPAHFDKLHALIRPSATEDRWTQIPWMTSLWDARKKAAEEGKPILLWEMDGHPLGCV